MLLPADQCAASCMTPIATAMKQRCCHRRNYLQGGTVQPPDRGPGVVDRLAVEVKPITGVTCAIIAAAVHALNAVTPSK